MSKIINAALLKIRGALSEIVLVNEQGRGHLFNGRNPAR